jgi:hypothetical protein
MPLRHFIILFYINKEIVMDNVTIASRLRSIILENPLAPGNEIKALWKDRKEDGTITDQSVSTAKTILKKKLFCDEFPVFSNKFTISGVIRNVIAANPKWGDFEVKEYLHDVGIEVTRALISNVRSVTKSKLKKASLETPKSENPTEVGSPDPNQDFGPRARKATKKTKTTKKIVVKLAPISKGSFVEIERQLDELISKIDGILGHNSGIADQARRVRRLASAQLLDGV